jgi:hypothetical protein
MYHGALFARIEALAPVPAKKCRNAMNLRVSMVFM